MSPFKSTFSGGESEPSYPAKQILTTELILPSIENSYTTMKGIIENVNKTANRQGYIVVTKKGNKNDKYGDFCKVKLVFIKEGVYKENEKSIGQRKQHKNKQRTNYFFKVYVLRKDHKWQIRVKNPPNNHLFIANEAFAANQKFSQTDIVVI